MLIPEFELPEEPRNMPVAAELSAAARLDAVREALVAGDKQTAIWHIRALFAGTPHLEALFYGGVVSEQLGKLAEARSWYEKVLRLNGAHRGAQMRIAAIAQAAAHQAQRSQVASAAETAPGGHGFYVTLKNDPSPISKNAVALIDHLRMTKRPLVSDSPFALLLLVVALLIIPMGLLFVPVAGRGHGGLRPQELLAFMVAFPVIFAFMPTVGIWFQRAMRYELRDGVLKVTQGILSRHTDTYELFRVTNVAVRRGPLQRLFNSGTLNLTIEGGGGPAKKLWLVGLARGRELQKLQDDLRNLSQLLRQNPLIKGIIT